MMFYLNQSFELDVTAFIDEVVETGMTFFDVGAHVGYHTLRARAIVGLEGRVVAFEPLPNLFSVLVKNTERYSNVHAEQLAIYKESSLMLPLHYYGIRYANCTTPSNHRIEDDPSMIPVTKTIFVNAFSIDGYVARTNVIPDVIKLDIENGEFDALIGAEQTIRKHSPIIIMEGGDMGRTEFNNTRACINYLAKFGYQFLGFDMKTKAIVPHYPREIYETSCNILCMPKL